jgi:DNA polymerase sigma
VDISIQNVEPLPNTHLLRAYAGFGLLLRQLVILVKLWAKAEGVCGAQDGHLSSYSITLLIIYFLQVDPLINLPCLPTESFNGDVKDIPSIIDSAWTCDFSVAQLLERFFGFYSTTHCWGYEVVSPRLGKRLYVSDANFANLSGRESSALIHIEDPFLLTRNLSCVLGAMQQELLYKKMSEAFFALQNGQAPAPFWAAICSSQRAHAETNVIEPDVASQTVGRRECRSHEKQSDKQSGRQIISEAGPDHLDAELSAPSADEVPFTALLVHGMTWSL